MDVDPIITNMQAVAQRLGSVQGMRACLTAAMSDVSVAVGVEQLNRDQWLLNVENGTLDLRTGELKPHDRADLITCLAPVEFDAAAECPQWLRFLDQIMCEDQALIEFLQRAVGMSLAGKVREHVLLFCLGRGANGKSTFLNLIAALLGEDYALKAPPGLLMVEARGEHPTARASLFGKRFVTCIESEEGARLWETMVKELTGGDTITARRMREDFWSFQPTHTVWIATNHRPEIRGTDDGIWRRVQLIPFDATIAETDQDPLLPEKLTKELPGILNWAIEGCRQWQHDGLVVPDVVRLATSIYRAEMDRVGSFLHECCQIGPDCRVRAKDLFAAYKLWCEENGEVPVQRQLGLQLTERRFDRFTSNGTWYRGLTLR